MARIFSGIQPSGEFHLGNYLGALRQWVALEAGNDAIYCLVDLHALTVEIDPATLRSNTLDAAAMLLALGLDPDRCALFAQSAVPAHSQLAWLLQCTTAFGELNRMTQFKEKSDGKDTVSVGLFTYPDLMAADILLYETELVPVGDDQRQHLELTREVANRFNSRYGEVFTIPEGVTPKAAARVMDLQNPERKMSKSVLSPQGTVLVTDPPEVIERKIKRAVTDNDGEVRYDPRTKPGVSNLLELLSACTGTDPVVLAENYDSYGPLKADTAAALIAELVPIAQRRSDIAQDLGYVEKVLAAGAAAVCPRAEMTLARANEAVGLLPK